MINFPYTICYQNRKSLVICIREGEVFVKAPHIFSRDKIKEILQDKKSWIEKKLKEHTIHNSLFLNVKQKKKILYRGREFALILNSQKNTIVNYVFYFKNERSIQKFFIEKFFSKIKQLLFAIAEKMQVQPSSLKLINFKAKWGSCDKLKNIKLNWRVYMLPDSLLYYLLVHELAHIIELNHSNKFWQVVEKYCKSYKQLRKELKNYDFLTNLYR